MENRLMYELLARQKYEENLKFAEQQRILRGSRDSSPSVWKRLVGWAIGAQQASRRPARA